MSHFSNQAALYCEALGYSSRLRSAIRAASQALVVRGDRVVGVDKAGGGGQGLGMRVRAIDDEGLRLVEEWLADDPVGSAVFGGFYGRAVERWAPLLSAEGRWGWITFDDLGPIGFIDLEIFDAEAEISYYVRPARRGTGLGRPTIEHVIQLASEHGARFIHAAVDPTNLPCLAVLRAATFTESGPNEYGETDFELTIDA